MSGGTPLAVADSGALLGVIHLKDIVKPDIKERFAALRAMGIRTVMVTGDNPITAAAIASEAGVDDFLAEATPEDKLAYIRKEQFGGRLIAMCGDGTNDAPALAQADVGVAMQTGTQAAREAGNMVDLDSSPTKLIEIVEIGKQLLMTRGSLTTFSIANDVAKYFAILPAMFVTTYPELSALNVMRLTSSQSAILSAVIFNALIIIALIPLALQGVAYRPVGAAALSAPQPAHLWIGRARPSLHRHQGDRSRRRRPASCLKDFAMLQHLRPAVVLLLLFSALTGLVYPLAVTGVAQLAFPHQANGSLIEKGWRRRRLGVDRSELQERPLLPSEAERDHRHRPQRRDQDDRRSLQRRQFVGLEPWADVAKAGRSGEGVGRSVARDGGSGPVPADAVTTSASGLDPDVSPQTALAQAAAVAKARGLDEAKVRDLVEGAIDWPFVGWIGEPKVNILKLNLALDQLKSS